MRSSWMMVGLKSNHWSTYKKNERHSNIERRRSCKVEAEIEMMHLQAKEHQELPGR